ncbi:hypothetical protein OG321_36990 [Streptomyces sp. NBC_00424]|uniref:hypothetical protein n=1 Tax=Streptomyces sp. NBC_00424 TaxID=2903648 RepID=UPI002259AD47|nr:hypothetical protein [Streptomyces sp. NBC_00424]MCX5078049.1 hypothetical protein [Streptomyces sp. NBC_00424]
MAKAAGPIQPPSWREPFTRPEAIPASREATPVVAAVNDPGELPRLARVADHWAPLTAEDTYLDGLRALVDGLPTGRSGANTGDAAADAG